MHRKVKAKKSPNLIVYMQMEKQYEFVKNFVFGSSYLSLGHALVCCFFC